MKIFLDTADIDCIEKCNSTGLIDGITTNPILLSKSSSNKVCNDLISKICSIVKGPVSVEVISTCCDDMIKEGLKLADISCNIVVKLPMTYDGICACKVLSYEYNIKVNVTLCFSVAQAILAAKAGAYFISPFIGRLDDLSYDGLMVVKDICHVYSQYNNFTTQVLAASIRNPLHVVNAAKIGVDIVTISPTIFKQLFTHPLTDIGLESFLQNWQESGKKII
ncbi:fructose-6-phosphate aldolase [Neoehrlichia mikurensis]|uniref:Fructose-6-phosphate aldolase n=1 Tax=Neoehrlichia mikurensis TaxID=89586 RepID=A0A9Q9BYE8_9RICK|nr:fructose-6-phosphate aldolase [Neoehrlichia mikurensis]QXK91901.1 fructose-6-phosphate aldolase [Neoehrlichia mikurensis]QXK93114.1 fructose-6-phosphate aldolase [Neoehrlichia mikurensis]QXK93594.1 fructose-6-phosphate aldolase [Neoehrlichia mikurensis]UTO55453.1 fructose-6-phosphate aldolase [Neoehrlichia mikurensis]UTO56373.1 fructose-6-phosphate aldolase [Neoehrlichia mikurensis]